MHSVTRNRIGLAAALLVLLSGALGLGATHTVRKGDTLYSLAKRYKTSVSRLKAANRIKDPTRMRIGQRLTLPGRSIKAKRGSTAKPAPTKKPSHSRIGGGKRVIIDPGHGGRDWGAYKGGIKESYLNMRVAKKLEYILKQRGYSTAMTRRSDRFVSLSRRAALANRYRNAIFVSIHFNSTRNSWVRGAETFYAGSAGRSLASSIQREMVRRCRVKNRGVRFARFAVLVRTECPAVLVECGFMSNASERARCATRSYQSSAALAIADGIRKYRWR